MARPTLAPKRKKGAMAVMSLSDDAIPPGPTDSVRAARSHRSNSACASMQCQMEKDNSTGRLMRDALRHATPSDMPRLAAAIWGKPH